MRCVYCKTNLLTEFTLFCLLTWSMTESNREVTLTCGGDDVTERGSPGAPGKKGPIGMRGIQGFKGSKGEPGENDGWMEALQRMGERISSLETRLQSNENLVGILKHRNCQDILAKGSTASGLYTIRINGRIPIVYCDMETDGGGWLVFQRRIDGSQDFYKSWREYKNGFGNVEAEFWIGLENLHELTRNGSYELRVELMDFSNNRGFAEYSSFSIGSESTHYQLTVSGYSGNAGDSLTGGHNNQAFSTKDQDHDTYSRNCAVDFHGAWWYHACHDSNLNGEYQTSGQTDCRGIRWGLFRSLGCQSLKRVEMKLRPN